MAFEVFTAGTVAWFEGLLQDNSRDYFTTHKDVYERSVRQPLLALCTDLAAEFGGTPKMFRPNRDVRFSHDKSPYKTNAAAVLMDPPQSAAMLYVSVSADGLHAATGYYGMAKDQLVRFRRALTVGDDAPKIGSEMRTMLNHLRAAGYDVDDQAMTGMPRGFAKDAPNADLVRYKSLAAGRYLEPERIGDPSVRDWVADSLRDAASLNAWLDRHVGACAMPPEERTRLASSE